MNKGFTLLEMIVAVGILSIVILISSSAFLAVLNAQRKTSAIETIQENLRFSLEMMLREIRTGKFYYCGLTANEFGNGSNIQDCSDGGPALTFKNYFGKVVIYRVFNNQIQKSSDAGANFQPITFPEIQINNLKFYVVGSCPPPGSQNTPCPFLPPNDYDTLQPRVTITIRGEMDIGEKSGSQFNVQTTVSQREIDG